MTLKMNTKRKLLLVGLLAVGSWAALYSPVSKQALEMGLSSYFKPINKLILSPNAVDIGFAQAMMKHHDEAIILSTLAMHSTDPQIEKLTHAIVIAQSHERGLMQGWLTSWGKPVVPSGRAMDWVDLPTNQISIEDLNYISRCKASAGGLMPGSPSMNDFERLSSRTGPAKDRLFLELMIKHHEAAVEMAEFAGRHAQSELIKSLTNQIKREQLKELLMMKGML